ANALSPDHVDWEIIDAVHEATGKPRTSSTLGKIHPPASLGEAEAQQTLRPVSAIHIIRTRRSALDFDGSTGMAAAAFYRMLTRVMPDRDGARPVPWDCVTWL